MNVSLTPELERLVQSKVESGLYQTASEVVREALRLLQRQDEERAGRQESFEQALQIGLEQLNSGRSIELDQQELKQLFEDTKRRGREKLVAGARQSFR